MRKLFPLLLAICLVFTACSSQSSPSPNGSTLIETEPVETVEAESSDVPETAPELTVIDGSTITVRDDGTGTDSDESGMKKTVALTNRQIDYSIEQGPFIITVNSVQLADIEATSSDVASFLDMETGASAALFAVDITVENTSDETMTIYPNQSTIVTSTKEQVTCEIFLSDSIGGEFLGQVIKSGQVYFICKNSTAEDISQITWYIDSPHDSDLNHFGDDIVTTFIFDK